MNNKEARGFLEKQKKEAKNLIDCIDEDQLIDVINMVKSVSEAGGEIYTIGNGGSSSVAKHLAADLDKTADQKTSFNINCSSLVSNEPLITAWTNDESWEDVYEGQLKGKISGDDMLIAISVHGGTDGWSGNLVNAINYSNSQGAVTVGLAGFDGGKFSNLCDETILVERDSTVLVESLHVFIHHLIVYGLRASEAY
jgi:D-sedoheptulose 7-phosphate isomerase